MSKVLEATLNGFACKCCGRDVQSRTPIRRGDDTENFFCTFYCAAKWFAEQDPSPENRERFAKFEKVRTSFNPQPTT